MPEAWRTSPTAQKEQHRAEKTRSYFIFSLKNSLRDEQMFNSVGRSAKGLLVPWSPESHFITEHVFAA